jgi:methylenetetrahydrofolate reductase (NADPH)
VCFVNHCGGPVAVARFVAAVRELKCGVPLIPCLAVTADPASLAALASLPGTKVSDVAAVEAVSTKPAAVVDVAASEAYTLLAIPGVVGVNLSGAASSVSEIDSAEIMSALGQRVRSLADRVVGS